MHWYFESEYDKAEVARIEKEIEDKDERRYVLTQGRKLTPDSVNSLRMHFTIRAMPMVASLMKRIIRLVSPDSYRQALQILRGGKHGKPRA